MDKVHYYYNNLHLLGIQGMQKNTISLKTASKFLSQGPSKDHGLNILRISKGSSADFTIIDIEKSWIVKGNNMLFLSLNTCFEKMPMQGKVLSCWKDEIEIYQCN